MEVGMHQLVCANIAEAYRKRLYPKHFVSKISDADSENSETQVWIEFAYCCQYITKPIFCDFISQSEEVGRILHFMINHPAKSGSK